MFKKYGWRKAVLLITIILTILILTFSILQIMSLYDFASRESEAKAKYLQDYKLVGDEQKTLFTVLISIVIIVSTASLCLSTVGAVQIFTEKYSAYLYLRIITWLMLSAFVCLFIIIAIKPRDIEFRIDPKNPKSELIHVEKPKYNWAWISFAFVITLWFSSMISRNNFGFVNKNINIKKYNSFINNKK